MGENTRFALGFILCLSILVLVACRPGDNTAVPIEESSGSQSSEALAGSTGMDQTQSESALSSRSVVLNDGLGSSTQSVGIWVTGSGMVSINPDLVKLNLGVETVSDTVEESRSENALAMSKVFEVLEDMNVPKEDIQTRNFKIYPQYTYQEVCKKKVCSNERILTGYRVYNSLVVELRDLENVGGVLDNVMGAAGDSIRIDQVLFTIADDSSSRIHAREKAVLDALAKADQFAEITGVARGNLLYIKENVSGTPGIYDYGSRMEISGLAETPLSAGDLDIEVQVTAVFAIEVR